MGLEATSSVGQQCLVCILLALVRHMTGDEAGQCLVKISKEVVLWKVIPLSEN